ncbi:MAG TPA: SDR family NAD(P)-dependent oxidoreductase [Acidimicrobiia bacterium]|nr:SDR family NAD(P)-dependent oxidoreductase [Acidimicrobiia bacterium]
MKTVLITGVSSGIGRATAIEMGRRGYHVVAAGRSEARTMPVVTQVSADGGSAEFLNLDLASLESARQAAMTFERSGKRLDVLINNAAVGGTRGVTADGFEINFGVNHLGHFMLTHHLRRTFVTGARIVVLTSEMHRRASGIDFDRVQQRSRSIAGLSEYAVSKLANILFARRFSQLQPGWRTYAVHPGLADTNIFPRGSRFLFRNRRPPEEAAVTGVWCATAPELADESGRYYAKREARQPSAAAMDDELGRELWARSERWCGVAPQHSAQV